MSDRLVTLEVFRHNPESGKDPNFQVYPDIPCPDEWVVLDALNYVKENLDTTLSYRWSCHMAVCGSCGMMIDGEAKLACKAFIRDFGDVIRVEPLANYPVEKDLVTNIEDFMSKITEVKPYTIPKKDAPKAPTGEYLQTPKELKKYKNTTLCINCMLCTAACPQFGLVPEFLGPAPLSLAFRYNSDSRDGGRDIREEITAAHNGVWECSFVGACSEVCPSHVDPASSIQQMKIGSTLDWYKEHLLPGGKKSGGES